LILQGWFEVEEFGISQVNSHHEEANRAMNDMQPLLEALLRNTSQIKWILATILMFLMLAATGLTALIIKLNKMSDELGKKHNFSDVARDLLDKDDLEQVIKLALERLSKYPKIGMRTGSWRKPTTAKLIGSNPYSNSSCYMKLLPTGEVSMSIRIWKT